MPCVSAESFVSITANPPADSSHIIACVAPLPRLIIIPASSEGAPDCVDANKIKGSLTVKFCVFTVDVVPLIVKSPDTIKSPTKFKALPLKVKFASASAEFVVPSDVSILFAPGLDIVLNPVPDEPDVPEVPEVPVVPLVPSIPEVPEEPEVPEVPVVPLVPSIPEVPEEPEVPEVPVVPLVPSIPEVPEVPVVPDVPDEPEVPDVPVVPDVPSIPDDPLVPEVPSVPDAPDEPAAPEVPDVPEEPEVPEVPLTGVIFPKESFQYHTPPRLKSVSTPVGGVGTEPVPETLLILINPISYMLFVIILVFLLVV